MDQATAGSAHGAASTSLYGYDLRNFVEGYQQYLGSAHAAAKYALTHGSIYPIEHALDSLGTYDRAAFAALERRPHLPVRTDGDQSRVPQLLLSINTLGRLHIRKPDAPRPAYTADDQWIDIGLVDADEAFLREVDDEVARARAEEQPAFQALKRAMNRLNERGGLGTALERATDSIQHIDNVCFYIDDRFHALLERYANLIDTKAGKGFLSGLADKDYTKWTDAEILVVAAVHALFLSGGAGRIEEFNGLVLSATRLLAKLHQLAALYRSAGCALDVTPDMDVFELASAIGAQARTSVGKPWLRYRWIYGLNFHKVEKLLPADRPSEHPEVHLHEFGQHHHELVARRRSYVASESLFFTELACACLGRDLAGIPCHRGSTAVSGWIEYLMERIVVSAVRCVRADYGMSSSLRDLTQLVEFDEEKRATAVHKLTQFDFFTCFASNDLRGRLDPETADAIALSVQKRMMFNRWHFIPGNLDRHRVAKKRHWFYPPVIPDIAVHSNMHRAAHSKAGVKFSIRSPGPDMGRPSLQIAGQSYRGFFDVRVVRMDGEHSFTPDDLLRVRRRNLWLECVYTVLVTYLQGAGANRFVIKGFQPGDYLDSTELDHWPEDIAASANIEAHG